MEECLTEPLAGVLAAEKWDALVAGECQFAWLVRFVVAPAALFEVGFAGGWIDDSHGDSVFWSGWYIQLFERLARPSEYLGVPQGVPPNFRACHPIFSRVTLLYFE
jgi:hypothetical protein